MEKILKKIKMLEREIKIKENMKKHSIPYGQYNYIENKVKNGEVISLLDLKEYAKKYSLEKDLDVLYEKLDKYKDEFKKEQEEFFEMRKL